MRGANEVARAEPLKMKRKLKVETAVYSRRPYNNFIIIICASLPGGPFYYY
jgi:hypothetical protein